jgi:uncharacterized membrane protein (DUF485 family)
VLRRLAVWAAGRDGVDVVISLLLIVVPTMLGVLAMLVVRRCAPRGGFLSGMESADGIFSAAGAALAVLLAFVIFTVFESYENARTAAGQEAVAAQQMYSTAGFFPDSADELRGEVVCYSRSVINDEWPDMSDGRESPQVQGWVDRLDSTIQQTQVRGNGQGAALENWLSLSQDRLDARRTRLAEGRPFVPAFVWFVLILIVLLVVAFQCLFADPVATAFGQAIAMTAMTTTLVAALVLIWVLDRPFNDRGAQIEPSRMSAALAVMTHGPTLPATLPCDVTGKAS